jgi:hypothetical protein
MWLWKALVSTRDRFSIFLNAMHNKTLPRVLDLMFHVLLKGYFIIVISLSRGSLPLGTMKGA